MNRTMDDIIEDIGYQCGMLEESLDVLKTTVEIIGGFHYSNAVKSAHRAHSSIQVVIRDVTAIREKMLTCYDDAERIMSGRDYNGNQ